MNTTPIRLSLQSVFVIMAVCAIIAWGAAFVGPTVLPYWRFVAMSILMSVGFYTAAGQGRHGLTIGCSLVAAILCLLAMWHNLFFNALLLFLVACGMRITGMARPRVLSAILIGCASFSVWIAIYSGLVRLHNLERARQAFPIVSLEDRLLYEKGRQNHSSVTIPHDDSAAWANLDQTDDWFDSWRTARLQRVHSESYERFIRASGFGVGRMVFPSAERLTLPELHDIPFESTTVVSYDRDWFWDEPYRWEEFLEGQVPEKRFHWKSSFDFLHPNAFGYTAQPRSGIAGFLAHGFHHSPRVIQGQDFPWELIRLELVSLLKHETPRAYVLDHLPRMDQLSDPNITTRPLDTFESESLERLRRDEDIVIEATSNGCRMLGSLRARAKCLECHSVERGELLGAFSYQFGPK